MTTKTTPKKRPDPTRGSPRRPTSGSAPKNSAARDSALDAGEALSRERYVERVRDALTLSRAGELPSSEYLAALREIASDLDGMIAAAEEEALSAGDPDL